MKHFVIGLLGVVVLGTTAEASGSESESLAAGYAAAFAQLGSSRARIVYVTESATEVIHDVKEIQAWGGVVMIRRVGGKRELLDPARIVRIAAE